MIKTCDDCGKSFDIFNEGYGHQFFVVCGNCWATETERRQIGGVFTTGGN
jgi:ssDNA-binding Zn-finger/Zn-ribbon topoisomerase 1